MEKKPIIIDILNKQENKTLILNLYLDAKEFLDPEFQMIDDDIILSYIRAYFTNIYESIDSEVAKNFFLITLNSCFTIVDLMNDFIEKLNATNAKIGDIIYKDILDDLETLKEYKDTLLYKELSKSNEIIAKLINEFHGYVSINKLRKKAQQNSPYMGYNISLEEIEIIERTKKYFMPNQLAHLLYDEKISSDYYCDHTIKNDDEILKKLLVSTNKDNPRFEIVFPDGMILDYFKGDIRVKPYNYKEIIEYTKLFYAAYYDEMRKVYEDTIDFIGMSEEEKLFELTRNMILNSFINVISMLYGRENIYTQKMIDDAKKSFVKIKDTAKKYHL